MLDIDMNLSLYVLSILITKIFIKIILKTSISDKYTDTDVDIYTKFANKDPFTVFHFVAFISINKSNNNNLKNTSNYFLQNILTIFFYY